jgi:hypothetical protein
LSASIECSRDSGDNIFQVNDGWELRTSLLSTAEGTGLVHGHAIDDRALIEIGSPETSGIDLVNKVLGDDRLGVEVRMHANGKRYSAEERNEKDGLH